MGFNDELTMSNDLSEAGVLSTYRPETELYVSETYCNLNYCDTDVYNRKFRILVGKQLSLAQEYNIFDNILSKDFDTNIGLVNDDNKLLNFNSDNVLDTIYQMRSVTNLTNHLDIMYEGAFVRGYTLEGKYYEVQQAYAKSGHLLTDRGFVLSDYWDDTTFENVIPNYLDTLLVTDDYVEFDYSDDNTLRNQTLEVNDLYNTTGWLTDSPTSPVSLIYGATAECILNDEFVKVNYNPDEVLVNTFYLGEYGPLQYFFKPTNDIQPYIVNIEIFTLDKSKRKHMYIMYYGGIVNNVADKTKIHHVDYCDGDSNRISTFSYEYDSAGIINKITETY
jgi:hypothetical protein